MLVAISCHKGGEPVPYSEDSDIVSTGSSHQKVLDLNQRALNAVVDDENFEFDESAPEEGGSSPEGGGSGDDDPNGNKRVIGGDDNEDDDDGDSTGDDNGDGSGGN
ncbi:MAG: hypothetical protein COA97_09855 [Flavobacteriales bacterium]|nr:MAG: hypothetical protein COA97_09855 [Flavobacteriales bacterium]